MGRSLNSSAPPEIRLARPLDSTFARLDVERSIFSEPPPERTAAAARRTAAAKATRVQRRLHRSAARVARPASSARKLDWLKVVIMPSARTNAAAESERATARLRAQRRAAVTTTVTSAR